MDWIAIRKEYESTEISLKDLSTKHGISEGTMRSRKNREKWQRSGYPATCNATENATQRKKQRATKKNVATDKQSTKLGTTSKRKPKIKVIVNNREIELKENTDLTKKQRLFVAEYLIDLNAAQAALRAGYSPGTAKEIGYENLTKPYIASEIQKAMLERTKRTEISQDEVVNLLANVLRSNVTDFVEFGQKEVDIMSMFGPVKDKDGEVLRKTVNYVDFKPSSEVDGSLIQEVKMGKDGASLKLLDKLKAVELLGRHLGMFKDNNINIAVGVQIVDDIGSGEDEPG